MQLGHEATRSAWPTLFGIVRNGWGIENRIGLALRGARRHQRFTKLNRVIPIRLDIVERRKCPRLRAEAGEAEHAEGANQGCSKGQNEGLLPRRFDQGVDMRHDGETQRDHCDARADADGHLTEPDLPWPKPKFGAQCSNGEPKHSEN